MPITSIIEIVGLVAGLVAIILAYRHASTLQGLVVQMQAQALMAKSALEDMERAISTRYLTHFPLYFSEIVTLVGEAKEKIEVFCDFPAYGSFSSHKHFLAYRFQLQTKLEEGVDVEITCLCRERRLDLAREQFLGGDSEWEKKKRSGDFHLHLVSFLETHGRLSELEGLDIDGFLRLVEEEDQLTLSDLSKAKVNQITTHIPIYFWLIDNKKAIFTISSLSEKEIEHGFVTIDQRLISALSTMKRRYDRPAIAPAVHA